MVKVKILNSVLRHLPPERLFCSFCSCSVCLFSHFMEQLLHY